MQICLRYIALNGLKVVNQNLGRVPTATFVSQPNFANFLSSDHETRLFVPTAFNFKGEA